MHLVPIRQLASVLGGDQSVGGALLFDDWYLVCNVSFSKACWKFMSDSAECWRTYQYVYFCHSLMDLILLTTLPLRLQTSSSVYSRTVSSKCLNWFAVRGRVSMTKGTTWDRRIEERWGTPREAPKIKIALYGCQYVILKISQNTQYQQLPHQSCQTLAIWLSWLRSDFPETLSWEDRSSNGPSVLEAHSNRHFIIRTEVVGNRNPHHSLRDSFHLFLCFVFGWSPNHETIELSPLNPLVRSWCPTVQDLSDHRPLFVAALLVTVGDAKLWPTRLDPLVTLVPMLSNEKSIRIYQSYSFIYYFVSFFGLALHPLRPWVEVVVEPNGDLVFGTLLIPSDWKG